MPAATDSSSGRAELGRRVRVFALGAAWSLLFVGAIGCTTDEDGDSPPPTADASGTMLLRAKTELMGTMPAALGETEGALAILSANGLAESGDTDPAIDWISSFEASTGCAAVVTEYRDVEELTELLQSGRFDVASVPGDAALGLVSDRVVAPVNTALLANYEDVTEFLRAGRWNSVDGQPFGVPIGWTANVLQYRTDLVTPPPDSLKDVFGTGISGRRPLAVEDAPTTIADAALYLMAERPGLDITDPFALDAEQLRAVVAVLRRQSEAVGRYWRSAAQLQSAFERGDSVLGVGRQRSADALNALEPTVPVDTATPAGGSTGASDSWMITRDASHPNCAYQWIDWTLGPDINAAIAEWNGTAPANQRSCGLTADPEHCTTHRAVDAEYAASISFRTTPMAECLDGRTAVRCTTAADWADAWSRLRSTTDR